MTEPDDPTPPDRHGDAPADPHGDVAALGYQAALAELETILDRLEADVPDVDRIAADVARAAAIVEHCRGRILAARERVEAVVDSFSDPAEATGVAASGGASDGEAGPDADL